jgi:hypothetical protein
MGVIVKPRQGEGAGRQGAVLPWKILYLLAVYFKLNFEVFKDEMIYSFSGLSKKLHILKQ